MRVERAERLAEREDALAIRRSVFVDEQGVPTDRELDEHEESATHLLAYDEGRTIGTARLRPYDGGAPDGDGGGPDGDGGAPDGDGGEADGDGGAVGKVERVAIVPERRGEGLGRELVVGVEAVAREDGFDELVLDSQVDAVQFYERLGYEAEGEMFEDAGIPHRRMRKQL